MSAATLVSHDSIDFILEMGVRARAAATALRRMPTADKNAALRAMAQSLREHRADLLAANATDLARGQELALAGPLMDRLALTDPRIEAMAQGLDQVANLPDPVGQLSTPDTRPSGLVVQKMRVPLGVVGIIYESRPNVTVDAAALCLKAGNACILRGGSEALQSNLAIAQCISQGLQAASLDINCVQIVNTPDRAAVGRLLQMTQHIDVLIPRGGRNLIERISRESKVPVIKHFDGVCHVYIDSAAAADKAIAIAINAKTYRYGICGAMETLLVAADRAAELLPELASRYLEHDVELRGCTRTQAILPQIKAATTADWTTEYLAPVLAVRVVDGLEQAIEHIEKYGSHHTDAIVTEDQARAERFLCEVDSSSVMVNAPTCYADGFEYGLGAEIGISTDKLHVRGPVGLQGLTTEKWVVRGAGQARQ